MQHAARGKRKAPRQQQAASIQAGHDAAMGSNITAADRKPRGGCRIQREQAEQMDDAKMAKPPGTQLGRHQQQV